MRERQSPEAVPLQAPAEEYQNKEQAKWRWMQSPEAALCSRPEAYDQGWCDRAALANVQSKGTPAATVCNDYNADGTSSRIDTYLPAGTELYAAPKAPGTFDDWWAQIVSENGGAEIGADYRHWAQLGAEWAASVQAPAVGELTPFQERVHPWLIACFGPEIAADKIERNHRFLEESLELVQATGCTQSEAHQLVDYVFGRPMGEPVQEVGGVMVTLAALCLANGLDMHAAGETELARIWTKVEAIRAKQAAKPKHSPLPSHVPVQNQEPQP